MKLQKKNLKFKCYESVRPMISCSMVIRELRVFIVWNEVDAVEVKSPCLHFLQIETDL